MTLGIAGAATVVGAFFGVKALGAKGDFNDDPTTVSYTHLRAHETVLDLVCRLLLEKKKTQIQSHRIINVRET